MTVDERIRTALSGIVDDIVPNKYNGKKSKYIVYNYNSIGSAHAEGIPTAMRELVQVHLYMEEGENPNSLKKTIMQALFDHGFTWPDITNAGTGDVQHYVFECETWSAV